MLELMGHSSPRTPGLEPAFLPQGGVSRSGRPQSRRPTSGSRRPPSAAGHAKKGRDLSVILVWLDGGPPQHETYDPKPDAPVEFRGPLNSIETCVPGIRISELFPQHAKMMDRMSIIRSMHHHTGDHFAAAHWMLTGVLRAQPRWTWPRSILRPARSSRN